MEEKPPVFVGDHVEILIRGRPTDRSEGKVYKIISNTDPDNVQVVLTNGDSGTVVNVINSTSLIEKRIMMEWQHTENKASFGSQIMRTEVIPKTVQSFLNSTGGYLYIGIQDTGATIQERLIGIEYDLDLIRRKYRENELDKLCDYLQMDIMFSLGKYLTSDAELGPLLQINFPKIRNVMIMEIVVKQSPHPWFYKNLSRNNKEILFQLTYENNPMGKRILDDFYIRDGNHKKKISTMHEFYAYAKNRFLNNS